MQQQEIKDGMSQGLWIADNQNIMVDDAQTAFISGFITSEQTDIANCAAMRHAVNNTYNKKIDPTKVKEMYDQLNQIKMDLTEMQNSCMSRSVLDYVGVRLPILETLLQSAKLK